MSSSVDSLAERLFKLGSHDLSTPDKGYRIVIAHSIVWHVWACEIGVCLKRNLLQWKKFGT